MKKLKILHLEDSVFDHELLSGQLDRLYTLELLRVDTEDAFARSLSITDLDLIISDFTLPSYSGGHALTLAREKRPEVPFIFFSGTIGEEAAVESLRDGATDYILKHRPQKMIAAIERALRERDERLSRQEAEAALQRREVYFRALIENALDVISVLNREALFTYNSPSIQSMLGYTPEELAGVNAFSLVHPDDLESSQAAFARAIASPNELISAEFRIRHKDGAWRNLELIGKSLPPGQALEGVVINSRDVSEKRQTEAQLLRAQRMECLGVLAGGIAHDLNNILSPIVMGSELLKLYVTDPEALSVIANIEASSQRGSQIVKQVLSFARGAKREASRLDLKPLVLEVVKLLRETFPKNIQFETLYQENTRQVICNITEVHQVLMNLCVNARDAMPAGGLLQIKAANVTLTSIKPEHRADVEPGDFVRLTVADSGTGISEQSLAHIFEPFYTTKEEGKGTGLGLSTVLSIVKRHGGFIEIETALGRGTQFHVHLPAADAQQSATVKSKSTVPDGRGELILLVDDESAILEMARVVLENSNYRVLVASEGVQALQAVLAGAGDVNLVITDASMPIMDGPALIKELHRISRSLPVICTSGQASSAARTRVRELGVDCILDKPYTANQLLAAVSTALRHNRVSPLQPAPKARP